MQFVCIYNIIIYNTSTSIYIYYEKFNTIDNVHETKFTRDMKFKILQQTRVSL